MNGHIIGFGGGIRVLVFEICTLSGALDIRDFSIWSSVVHCRRLMEETEGKECMYRGRAIIIANRDFQTKEDERTGARRDLFMMKALFQLLDFEVKTYINLTGEEIREKLAKAKEWKHEYDPSCFVCVISSHGEELKDLKTSLWYPSVAGTGGDGDKVYINDITSMFSDTNCEKYKGKPKLFFIQACRSSKAKENCKYDGGINIRVAKDVNPMGSNNKTDEKGDNTTENKQVIKHSESADSVTDGISTGSAQYQKQTSATNNQDLSDGEWDGTLSDNEDEKDTGKGDASDSKGGGVGAESVQTKIIQESQMPEPPIEPNETSEVKTKVQESPMLEPPMDMVDVNCPKNCLVMFPVTSGRAGLRPTDGSGSWMIQFMSDCKNSIIKNGNLMEFLTSVSHQMAMRDFTPAGTNEKTKCTAVTLHRLTTRVIFEPMPGKSEMAKKRKEIEEEEAS